MNIVNLERNFPALRDISNRYKLGSSAVMGHVFLKCLVKMLALNYDDNGVLTPIGTKVLKWSKKN